jgi:hypothetical protein
MAIAPRIEIVLGSVISHATVAPMVTANLTKGMFTGDRLGLPQFPGWYVPEPVVFEPVVERGVVGVTVLMGDRFYGFTAKTEAYKSPEIYKVLSRLSGLVTLRDYCYLGGAGTPVLDSDGHYYVVRTGRLTLYPPQNVGKVRTGRPVHFETMELKFEQV